MRSYADELHDEIRAKFPGRILKKQNFPSGSGMLWVDEGGETYVFEFVPNQGFGISRVSTAGIGFEGAEHAFDRFEKAREFLLGLLLKNSGTQ